MHPPHERLARAAPHGRHRVRHQAREDDHVTRAARRRLYGLPAPHGIDDEPPLAALIGPPLRERGLACRPWGARDAAALGVF